MGILGQLEELGRKYGLNLNCIYFYLDVDLPYY